VAPEDIEEQTMGGMVWDPALDTGEALVDAQHRGLVELLNELDSVEETDVKRIVAVLDLLDDRLSAHFTTEEDFMSRLSYPAPAAEAHMREHRSLAAAQDTMSIDYRRGWVVGTAPLVAYMSAWLSDHIETYDRLLAEHVRGVRERAPAPE
jgi:hemerythrin